MIETEKMLPGEEVNQESVVTWKPGEDVALSWKRLFVQTLLKDVT